jgi:hypothetical protein
MRIWIPSCANTTVAVSIIHHMRVEGGKFIGSGTQGENQEKIFGFVAGFTSTAIGMLFTNLISEWQDSVSDCLQTCPGRTAKLFMAATISQCYRIVSQDITSVNQRLNFCDSSLQGAVYKQRSPKPDTYKESRAQIDDINKDLIEMTEIINGTGSVLRYLANSIDILVGSISRFKEYMEAHVQRCDGCLNPQDFLKALEGLDSAHDLARDRNQLELVAKIIDQCQVEAQDLLQRISIGFGIVGQPITTDRCEITDYMFLGPWNG